MAGRPSAPYVRHEDVVAELGFLTGPNGRPDAGRDLRSPDVHHRHTPSLRAYGFGCRVPAPGIPTTRK